MKIRRIRSLLSLVTREYGWGASECSVHPPARRFHSPATRTFSRAGESRMAHCQPAPRHCLGHVLAPSWRACQYYPNFYTQMRGSFSHSTRDAITDWKRNRMCELCFSCGRLIWTNAKTRRFDKVYSILLGEGVFIERKHLVMISI